MKKKKKKEDGFFVDTFKEFSIEVTVELIASAILRTLLFIPRLIIRFFSSL